MKIELIKETKAVTGEVWYSVYKDDHYVEWTVTQDPEQAQKNFEGACKYPEKIVETLKSSEI